MIVADALRHVGRLFVDTAPLVYYVERHPAYGTSMDAVFTLVDAGSPVAVTSAVTLAECLVHPIRLGLAQNQQAFTNVVLHGANAHFVALDAPAALQAAELRARYNLTLTDAFQVAAALVANCDSFLTNDRTLLRVREIPVLLVDDLQP